MALTIITAPGLSVRERLLLLLLRRYVHRRLSLSDTFALVGRFRVRTFDRRGRQVQQTEWAPNLITTNGKALALELWGNLNDQPYSGMQYLAVGTGAGTPATGDTALFTELARTPVTLPSVSGTTLDVQGYFTSGQANGTWTNAGVFGNGATTTLGSGTLINHALLSYTKDNLHEAVTDYQATIS